MRRAEDPNPFQRLIQAIAPYGSWVSLALLILFVTAVRFRVREMPLERDEGEYAYAGQLILQGVPPYQLAYNLKFPGIYAAYALVMLVFGQSTAGIHIGLWLVNVISIVLMFFLGRGLLGEMGGTIAAITFAILSLSVAVLGLAAHASHFVMLFALAGTLLMLRASLERKRALIFSSGVLFGIGFLMKQPGFFWAVLGLGYLVWSHSAQEKEPHRRRPTSPFWDALKAKWKASWKEAGIYCLGIAMPFVVMCLLLAITGVFSRFIFWTFTYAREYVSVNPLFKIPTDQIRQAWGAVFGPNLMLWVVAVLGAVLMWWEDRLRKQRVFIAGFVVVSLVAVCPGWYFRQHYFIFMLPAAGLLAGIAINRGIHLVRHDRTIELFLALIILALFPIGLAWALIGNGPVWFELSPEQGSRETFVGQMFPEEAALAEYIRTHAQAGARVAVLGSEPEVYFLSRRHSATGYIYAYPLMELQRYASRMQEEMIREIENIQPEYIVFVQVLESWLIHPQSDRRIIDWYEQYTKAHYDLVKTLVERMDERPDHEPARPQRTPGMLLLFQRKAAS